MADAGHRLTNFNMLTPKGTNIMEIPGKLDEPFPLC
jgi:hypothetical protein